MRVADAAVAPGAHGVREEGDLMVGRFGRARASRSDGLSAAFAGADSDAIFEREDEDLAVADLARVAGASGVNDRFHGRFDEGIIDGDLQFQLGQQAHLKLGAAINLGVPSLSAAASDVADGHQVYVALVERLLDGFQFIRPDDGGDQLQAKDLSGTGLCDLGVLCGCCFFSGRKTGPLPCGRSPVLVEVSFLQTLVFHVNFDGPAVEPVLEKPLEIVPDGLRIAASATKSVALHSRDIGVDRLELG